MNFRGSFGMGTIQRGPMAAPRDRNAGKHARTGKQEIPEMVMLKFPTHYSCRTHCYPHKNKNPSLGQHPCCSTFSSGEAQPWVLSRDSLKRASQETIKIPASSEVKHIPRYGHIFNDYRVSCCSGPSIARLPSDTPAKSSEEPRGA